MIVVIIISRCSGPGEVHDSSDLFQFRQRNVTNPLNKVRHRSQLRYFQFKTADCEKMYCENGIKKKKDASLSWLNALSALEQLFEIVLRTITGRKRHSACFLTGQRFLTVILLILDVVNTPNFLLIAINDGKIKKLNIGQSSIEKKG